MIDEKKFMEFMASLEEAGAEHVSFDDLRKFIDEQPKISVNDFDIKEIYAALSMLPMCQYAQLLTLMGRGFPAIERWIPCSEEMPQDGVKVFLSCRYMFMDYVTVGYFENKTRKHSYIADDDMFFRSTITAWQPLPEPYREGE